MIMAKVYGIAGESAIRELRESVLSRTHPDYVIHHNDDSEETPVWIKAIGIHIICFIIFVIAINIIVIDAVPGALILLGDIIIYIYLMLKASKKPDSTLSQEPQEEPLTSDIAITEEKIRNDFQMVLNGKKPSDPIFNSDENRWAIGAAGEIVTSDLIENAFDDNYSLINDIIITKNGREAANIDHVFLSNNGIIMLDTKMWNGNLKFSQRGRYHYIARDDMYWETISTCVWEANKLPVRPRAIVMSVGGRVGHKLKNNAMSLNAYIEKYDRSASITPSDYPIILVSQEEIAPYLQQLDATLPQGRFVSPERLMNP